MVPHLSPRRALSLGMRALILISIAASMAACSSETIGYDESAVAVAGSDLPATASAGSGADPQADLNGDGLPPDDLAYVDDPLDADAGIADTDEADEVKSGDFEDEPYVWTGFLADGETIVSESGRILVTCGSRGIDVELDGAELVNVVVENDGLTQFFGGLSGSIFSTPGRIDTVWVRIVGEDPGESPDGPGYGERFDC